MEEHPTIRSRSNSLLKRVGAVLAGKEPGTLVLEGERLVQDALRAGRRLEVLLVTEERADQALELAGAARELRLVESGLLDRVSDLKTSPGVLALCPRPEAPVLAKLPLDPRSLLLVVAGIADPGNLGALARSAEAAGATGLVVLAGGASPWSSKALRGSMGSLLRLSVFEEDSPEDVASVLSGRGARQVRAATRGGTRLPDFDWSGPVALWVGPETGLMPEVSAGFEGVTIPTAREVESLNVTVAASLLLFAAGRVGGGPS